MMKKFCIFGTFLAVIVLSQNLSSASEAERNKKIDKECQAKAMEYSDGDGQTTAQCQQAIHNKCMADELGQFYPDAKSTWTSRVSDSCQILGKMGDRRCPACK